MNTSRQAYNPQFTPEFSLRRNKTSSRDSINIPRGLHQSEENEPTNPSTSLRDPFTSTFLKFTTSRNSALVPWPVLHIMKKPELSWNGFGGCLKSNLRLILMLLSIAIGIALGFGLRAANIHKDARNTMYVYYIGEIFLNMLKVVILPLIVSSLITGLAQMESQTSGKIGARAVIYYLTTTIMAVILGIVLVTTIRPGEVKAPGANAPVEVPQVDIEPATTADTFLDLIRNMFPPNIVQACVAQYRTVLKKPEVRRDTNITTLPGGYTTGNEAFDKFLLTLQAQLPPPPSNNTPHMDTWKIGGKFVEGTNILGVVVFSIIFGLTISRMGAKGKALGDFFFSLNEVMMSIVGLIMNLAPIGITFIVAGQILKVDDFASMIAQLGMYFMTVMVGLVIHGLIVLPVIYLVITRRNPWKFLAGATRAFATGFATSSSSATLPITIECCEENNGVDPRISRFVLPIGATINMDGTALYEAVAAIFVGQTQGVEMTFGKIVAVSITATAAAIGAAGVPQAGLVTLVMVLDAVGLSAEFVGTILAVDWLLDRFRTTINILGDVLGTGIVDHLCRGFLRKIDAKEAAERAGDAIVALEEPSTEMQVVYPGLGSAANGKLSHFDSDRL